MTELFTPLAPVTAKGRELVFVPLNSKSSSPTADRSALETFAGVPASPPSATGVCAKPTITLERNGEIVSAIRIRCGCGEVVELTCVY